MSRLRVLLAVVLIPILGFVACHFLPRGVRILRLVSVLAIALSERPFA